MSHLTEPPLSLHQLLLRKHIRHDIRKNIHPLNRKTSHIPSRDKRRVDQYRHHHQQTNYDFLEIILFLHISSVTSSSTPPESCTKRIHLNKTPAFFSAYLKIAVHLQQHYRQQLNHHIDVLRTLFYDLKIPTAHLRPKETNPNRSAPTPIQTNWRPNSQNEATDNNFITRKNVRAIIFRTNTRHTPDPGRTKHKKLSEIRQPLCIFRKNSRNTDKIFTNRAYKTPSKHFSGRFIGQLPHIRQTDVHITKALRASGPQKRRAQLSPPLP